MLCRRHSSIRELRLSRRTCQLRQRHQRSAGCRHLPWLLRPGEGPFSRPADGSQVRSMRPSRLPSWDGLGLLSNRLPGGVRRPCRPRDGRRRTCLSRKRLQRSAGCHCRQWFDPGPGASCQGSCGLRRRRTSRRPSRTWGGLEGLSRPLRAGARHRCFPGSDHTLTRPRCLRLLSAPVRMRTNGTCTPGTRLTGTCTPAMSTRPFSVRTDHATAIR